MGGGMVRLIWPKIYNSNYWAAKQQNSWVIAPWWFNVSPWQICITFVWPRGSVKLTVPSSWSERHLHFASIILCLALLFIISMYGNAQRFILRFPFRCKQRQNKKHLLTWCEHFLTTVTVQCSFVVSPKVFLGYITSNEGFFNSYGTIVRCKAIKVCITVQCCSAYFVFNSTKWKVFSINNRIQNLYPAAVTLGAPFCSHKLSLTFPFWAKNPSFKVTNLCRNLRYGYCSTSGPSILSYFEETF
jgi:hypothetical protein